MQHLKSSGGGLIEKGDGPMISVLFFISRFADDVLPLFSQNLARLN